MNLFSKTIHKLFRKVPLLYSDKSFTANHFNQVFGYYPDIDNPITFNEKINYKKLYDHNPLLEIAADKIAAREYIENLKVNIYFPKIYRVFRSNKDISFDNLPKQYVVKASHGSGWVKFVYNKDKEDHKKLKNLCRKWLKSNYYFKGREYCYKNLQPGIIVEELLLAHGEIPTDYKFFCFHGKVKLFAAYYSKFINPTRNFFDEKGNLLNLWSKLYKNNPNINQIPNNYKKLINISEKISKDFDFVRVDLYTIDKKIFFGELTNFPANGFFRFVPIEFDKTLGSYWKFQEYS